MTTQRGHRGDRGADGSQGNGEPRLSPRIVKARVKQSRAVELRAQGLPWAQVAEGAGYRSEAAAIKAADAALNRMPSAEDRDKWRSVELVRLELAYQAIVDRIVEGDDGAIRSLVALSHRKAKLLGLDPLPSLNSVGIDTVQGALDAIVGLAVRLLADEVRSSFLEQVETTLLQIEAPRDGGS